MSTSTQARLRLLASGFTFVLATLFTAGANAALITDWQELTGGIPATDLDTASPIIGDGGAASAETAIPAGRFAPPAAPVTLEVGNHITFFGQTVLTGGAGNPDEYRFGIYNDGGQFDAGSADNWLGGYTFAIGSAGGDIYRARTDGTTISVQGNAVGLGATFTESGTFDPDSAAPYDWSISISRVTAGIVGINVLISGGDGGYDAQVFAADMNPAGFDFTAGAWLFGGQSDLDQAAFTNVSYAFIPEPATLLLLAAGLAMMGGRLRRTSAA